MFFPYPFFFSHPTLLHQVFCICNPTSCSCLSRHQTDRLMTANPLPPLLLVLLLLHYHQRSNKCNVALSSLTLTVAGSGYHGILTSDAVGTVSIRSENATINRYMRFLPQPLKGFLLGSRGFAACFRAHDPRVGPFHKII